MKTQFRHCAIMICLHLTTCWGHLDSAYMTSPNDGFTNRNKWMSQIRDDVQLSELALPGTHGSAAFLGKPTTDAVEDLQRKLKLFPPFSNIAKPILTGFTANQGLDINEQLDYGIRVFDVRILYTDEEFGIMQGGRFLHIMFDVFLDKVVNFLNENPTETVLIAVIIEREVGKNKKSASTKLNDYLKENHVSRFHMKTKNPRLKLGDVRGKFIVLARDKNFNKNFLDFYGLNFNVMDKNHLSTRYDLYKKWDRVKEHLEEARKGDKNMFYVTYLTGYGGTFPYFVASGHFFMHTSSKRVPTGFVTPLFKDKYPDFPRLGCTLGICNIVFEGVNQLTRDKLKSYNDDIPNQQRTVGIIMADFPGDSLIENIIENNNNFLK